MGVKLSRNSIKMWINWLLLVVGWLVPYLFVFLVMINALFLGAQVYKQSHKPTSSIHALIIDIEKETDTEFKD